MSQICDNRLAMIIRILFNITIRFLSNWVYYGIIIDILSLNFFTVL